MTEEQWADVFPPATHPTHQAHEVRAPARGLGPGHPGRHLARVGRGQARTAPVPWLFHRCYLSSDGDDPLMARPGPGQPFSKGVSGNPKGRPPLRHDVRTLARRHGLEALQVLVDLMHDADPRVRVRAAEAVLDRAYGRPAPELVHAAQQGGVTVVLQQYVPGPVAHPPRALGEPAPPAEDVRVRMEQFGESPPADAAS